MPELAHWDSFYVIVGSSAGALIGLQFVVLTLVAERPPVGAAGASAAFASPTVVHFGTVLFISAALRVPWQTITPIAILLGLTGLAGVAYTANVSRRMRVQIAYKPDFEDWLCHVLVPMLAYVTLGLSGLATHSYEGEAPFGVGAAVLVLLFIAIHNAWDAIEYHVRVRRAPKAEKIKDST